MTSSTERVAKAIACRASALQPGEVERFEALWQVKCPSDLHAFWTRWGTGKGWAKKEGEAPFLSVYAPADAIEIFGMPEVKETMPKTVAPFGDDGSGEMIVLVDGTGYGLLQLVHGGLEDVLVVADTLEDFFDKTERDNWFPEPGVTQ